jgi:hypothetical protein
MGLCLHVYVRVCVWCVCVCVCVCVCGCVCLFLQLGGGARCPRFNIISAASEELPCQLVHALSVFVFFVFSNSFAITVSIFGLSSVTLGLS